jgi:hypothetical protein
MAPHVDLGFGAEHGFLEGERDVLTKVCAALCPGAPPAAPGPEHLAEPKAQEIVQNVTQIDRVDVESSACGTHCRMTETIIEGAFLPIAKYGVSFRTFLKFFFRLGIVRIAVRVILQSEFAISTLDFLLSSSA